MDDDVASAASQLFGSGPRGLLVIDARVAEVPGQLAVQSGLDHPPRELRQQAASTGDLLRPQPLHSLLESLLGQQALSCSATSCESSFGALRRRFFG
ncbi:MAG: hypothetical protein QOH12_2908 [Solirubrobacteraceae bacterium]|nr:hypothetical protein [Solirubrobacteraceae bacterium]